MIPLRERLITEDSLHRRIVGLRRQGMHGVPTLVEVIEGSELQRGGHSWLERKFLELLARSRLPRPTTQAVLGRAGDRLMRVDFRFPGTPVVVEVLGYRWHRSSVNLRRDAERLNAILDLGLRPYQFTYAQIVEEPDRVMANVRPALMY